MSPENNKIRLIFFPGKDQESRKKILHIIKKLIPEDLINIHTNLESLLSDLRKPDDSQRIILIISKTQKDLSNILLLKELLNDQHLIMILPDTTEETMSQAYKLYPRYISHIQKEFKDVKNVLGKMINKLQTK